MTPLPEVKARTEVRDGMRITWHQPIPMDDGIVLRADVFQPIEDGRYPVILTYGLYAKGLSYQEGYPHQWQKMVEDHPEILEGSTNKYQNWEVTDPERWVPHGYAVIRVDSRGAGWSPGFMQPNSLREFEDLYQCIEWAGSRTGAVARSECSGFPITPGTSGTSRAGTPRISLPLSHGKAGMIATGIPVTMVAS